MKLDFEDTDTINVGLITKIFKLLVVKRTQPTPKVINQIFKKKIRRFLTGGK